LEKPEMSRIAQENIRLKRAYEPATADDGVRVLVDRLWPRGLKKANAAIDSWFKEIAPSTELRRWFGHDAVRWGEFRRRYRKELDHHPKEIDELQTLARRRPITLVFAAHDELHNEAVVLRDFLIQR
jgi:uncharacterized protein YeaO (DUF488 family)